MKGVMRILLLLGLLGTSNTCNNSLFTELQGEWMCIEDMDCPDVILLHQSGRYIIFNNCGNRHFEIPIVEKGDWNVKKNKELVLKNREFDPGGYVNAFRDVYGTDAILLFSIKHPSKHELILNFNKNGKKYSDHYRRVRSFPEIMRVYSGYGSKIEHLALPSSGARTLLKISYKVPFYVVGKIDPIELIVEDQDSHELWRKTLVFTEDIQKEEILLADKPEVIQLNELIFKINAGKLSPSWDIKVTIY